MWARCLRFVLLVWFPGVLHGQSAALPCPAPTLNGGYFVPENETYAHETKLTYACEKGLKPAAEVWWATSTCQNGKWSHEPQCIAENACIPPAIPNAKYTENQNGWYEEGNVIRITCDKGYEYKDRNATATCRNGTWSSVLFCERSTHACGEPPKIPHAVIIHQDYQELFAPDSEVQYECEDGYTIEGGDTRKSIFCMSGTWSEGPACRPATSSRTSERETEPQITPISNCGRPPTVPNGEVVEASVLFLRYQCSIFYKRTGPETVMCYSDGTWSHVPTCRAAFCSVDTDRYPQLKPDGVKYIKDGETVRLECVKMAHWWMDHFSVGRCTDRRIWLSRCCNWLEHKAKTC
ncbi:complement factor H-related protein 1-like [Chelmon rostratus]|uniref:complement factor H-related protein 1-like n=1 Tax=Chelmon rostratus TaxID=109905 RepID=UPI001BE62D89|nr:complement factor H-related protein 1-like [Chelmon rostratus]